MIVFVINNESVIIAIKEKRIIKLSYEKTRVLDSLNIRFNYRSCVFDGILEKFGTKKD